MHPANPPSRFVELEGCLNFRDLGGYRTDDGRMVRWRRLFRSDALHALSPAAAARVRSELGVRMVVDLRSWDELDETGKGAIHRLDIQIHHEPLFTDLSPEIRPIEIPSDPNQFYVFILRASQSAIARVLMRVADSEHPAVFHCAAGKDRTGVIAAVLLGLLGVRDEDIVDDYAQTGLNIETILDRLRESETYQTRFARLPHGTLKADPQMMSELLLWVRSEYGDMRSYARAAGLSDATMHRLEEMLLVEDRGH